MENVACFLGLSAETIIQASSADPGSQVISRLTQKLEEWRSTELDLRKQLLSLRREKADAEQQVAHIERQFNSCSSAAQEERMRASSLDALLSKKEEQLQVVKSQTKSLQELYDDLSASHSRLVSGNLQLESEKNELLDVLARKQSLIQTLEEDWRSLNDKFNKVLKEKCQAENKVDEILNQDYTAVFKERRLHQEKQLLQQTNEALNAQVKSVSEQLVSTIREKAEMALELNRTVEAQSFEINNLRTTSSKLKSSNDELEEMNKCLIERLEKTRAGSLAESEQYQKEIACQAKMASLYRESAESCQKSTRDLVVDLENLRIAADQLKRENAEYQSRIEELAEICESNTKEYEAKLHELRCELNSANGLLEKHKTILNIEHSARGISPMAAATSAIMKSGMTLSQIYHEYTLIVEKLSAEKEENNRMRQYLEQIVKEVEEKAPQLMQLRHERDRLMNAHTQMAAKLTEASKEINHLKLSNTELKEDLARISKEEVLARQAVDDLSAQVRVLLKECDEARCGLPNQSDDQNTSQDVVSSSQDIISRKLVQFRNIEELQQQNQRLLAVVRKLSEESERVEAQSSAANIQQLRTELTEKCVQLDEVRSARDVLQLTNDALRRQLDTYKYLVNVGRTSSSMHSEGNLLELSTSSDQEYENALLKMTKDLDQSKAAYLSLREERQQLFNESLEQDNAHRTQIAALNDELSSLKLDNLRLTKQVEMLQMQADLRSDSLEALKRELKLCTDRIDVLNQDVVSAHSTRDALKQEVAELKDKHHSTQLAYNSLQIERETIKRSELLLTSENKQLLDQLHKQLDVIANLQVAANSRQHQDYESRSTLNAKIESLEASLNRMKSAVEASGQHGESKQSLNQGNCDELRRQLQVECASHEQTRTRLSDESKKLEGSQRKVSELEAVLSKIKDTALDNDAALLERLRQLESSLIEQQLQANGLKDQLSASKQHLEQYRSIADNAEQALRKLTEEATEEKSALQEKVRMTCDQLSELQRRYTELESVKLEEDGRRAEQTKEYEEKISTLTAQVLVLNSQLQTSSETLRTRESVEDSYRTEMQILRQRTEEMQSKYEHQVVAHAAEIHAKSVLAKKVDAAEALQAATQAELETFKDRVASLTEAVKLAETHTEEERQKLEVRCTELSEHNSQLYKQIDQLASRLSSASVPLETSSALLASVDKSYEDVWEVVRYNRREKDIAEAKLEATEAESMRYKHRLELVVQELKEAEASLKIERERTRGRMFSQEEYDSLLHEVGRYRELQLAHNAVLTDKDNLESSKKDLETLVEQVKQELTGAREKLETLVEEKLVLVQQTKELKSELEKVNVQLADKLSKRREDEEKELQAVKERARKAQLGMQKKVKEMQEALEQSSSSNNKLQSELSEARLEVTTIKSHLDKVLADQQGVAQLTAQLEESKKLSEQQLTDQKNKLMALNRLCKKLKAEKESLEKNIPVDQSKEQLLETESRVAALKKTVLELESAGEESKKKLAEQTSKLEEVENSKKSTLLQIKMKLQSVEAENTEMKKTITGMTDQIKQSKHESEMRLSALHTQYEGKLTRLDQENKELRTRLAGTGITALESKASALTDKARGTQLSSLKDSSDRKTPVEAVPAKVTSLGITSKSSASRTASIRPLYPVSSAPLIVVSPTVYTPPIALGGTRSFVSASTYTAADAEAVASPQSLHVTPVSQSPTPPPSFAGGGGGGGGGGAPGHISFKSPRKVTPSIFAPALLQSSPAADVSTDQLPRETDVSLLHPCDTSENSSFSVPASEQASTREPAGSLVEPLTFTPADPRSDAYSDRAHKPSSSTMPTDSQGSGDGMLVLQGGQVMTYGSALLAPAGAASVKRPLGVLLSSEGASTSSGGTSSTELAPKRMKAGDPSVFEEGELFSSDDEVETPAERMDSGPIEVRTPPATDAELGTSDMVAVVRNHVESDPVVHPPAPPSMVDNTQPTTGLTSPSATSEGPRWNAARPQVQMITITAAPCSNYEEGGDCLVPSTPTLLVPERSENFAEAVPVRAADLSSTVPMVVRPDVQQLEPHNLEDIMISEESASTFNTRVTSELVGASQRGLSGHTQDTRSVMNEMDPRVMESTEDMASMDDIGELALEEQNVPSQLFEFGADDEFSVDYAPEERQSNVEESPGIESASGAIPEEQDTEQERVVTAIASAPITAGESVRGRQPRRIRRQRPANM